MKKVIASIVLTGFILIASALPAHALNRYNCYQGTKTVLHSTGYVVLKGTWCYYDYNWWEESWMGGSKRDGNYFQTNQTPVLYT